MVYNELIIVAKFLGITQPDLILSALFILCHLTLITRIEEGRREKGLERRALWM